MLVDVLEPRTLLTVFVDAIDNPYLPLIPGTTYIYRGSNGEGDPIRNRVTVTHSKKLIMGVRTTVVRDREYEGGEIVEDTRDYFAQDKAGNVWYFGEDSREIENGMVVSTQGSWLAGVNGATAGIIMRARPGVGDRYQQENAPGIAEDEARVLGFGARAGTPFAVFGDCLQTEEFTDLEPDVLEHKFYAPGIGFVKSQDVSGGKEVTRLAYVLLEPEAYDDVIDNPYLPLIPGITYIYRGSDEDGLPIRDRFTVTSDTRVITGVTTTVVRDRAFVDGELVEDTLDYFAQDKAGNVWYFGEDSKDIEDGVVVSTDGSWLAGVNGAKPGIIMRALPGVGDAYKQETAVGVAEDQAQVLALHEPANVPFANFGDCLKTAEFTRLEPDVLEHKFYAPGIGLVKAQGITGGSEVLRLAYILFDA
jgi:hypothetical protein